MNKKLVQNFMSKTSHKTKNMRFATAATFIACLCIGSTVNAHETGSVRTRHSNNNEDENARNKAVRAHHEQMDRNHNANARIVGGGQADLGEYPYYGT